MQDSNCVVESEPLHVTKATTQHPYHKHRSNKSAGVILIDPWSSNNIYDPSSYRVMVVQQRNSGAWGLPKGHLEKDEDLMLAAHRELLEETGVDMDTLLECKDYMPLPVRHEPSSSSETPNRINHLQIKKIHFFVYILMRRGSSLVHGHYDQNEISAVSWMNVHGWYVELLGQNVCDHRPPRFNRTLSDTSVNILKDICEKTSQCLRLKYGNDKPYTTVHRCLNLF